MGAATPVASSGRDLKLRQGCRPRVSDAAPQEASLFHGDGGRGVMATTRRRWRWVNTRSLNRSWGPARHPSCREMRAPPFKSRSVQVSHHCSPGLRPRTVTAERGRRSWGPHGP